MAYCTLDDLKKIIPRDVLMRLTDDEDTGAVNEERVTEAVDAAAQEMDGYLGGRVALPITDTVPPVLRKLNADIAIYNLYSRVKETIPEMRNERYRNAIRFLEQMAAGKITLGLQPPPAAPGEGKYQGGGRVSSRDKIFDEDTMDKY